MEIWFSEYEAFALLNGLRLIVHGWPQGFAVSVMRRVRPELENEHVRILKQDKNWLFDQEAIRKNAKEGDLAFDNQDPVLLTIVSKPGVPLGEQGEPHGCAIRRGANEAMRFVWEVIGGGGSSMFEIVRVAHRLSEELALTEPRRRGPAG